MKTYDNAINQMSRLLKERNVCLHSRKAHEKCYFELRNYLIANNLQFSVENARHWLREGVNPGYQVRWHYVDQLDELIRTGTVLQDHLLLIKPNYEKLTLRWQSELDEYLINRKNDYSSRSFALAKIRCSNFLLKLQEYGISSTSQISYQSICDFYELEMPVTKKERYYILSHARQFLQYQVERNRCEPVLPLLLDEDIYKYSAGKTVDSEILAQTLDSLQTDKSICSARDVFDSIASFKEEFEKHNYRDTVKYNVVHILKCLYVFLEINNLDYDSMIAKQWYYQIECEAGQSYRTWIRVLNLFDKFIQHRELIFNQKYSFRASRMEMFPYWCAKAIEGYLNWLKRCFRSDGTIRTYKYSVYNFCDYLLQNGVDSFYLLDKPTIITYLNHDKQRTTVNGLPNTMCVLRQFITYLEDYNFVKEKTLHYVFPQKVASVTRIVSILSKEQVLGIDKFRQECTAPIELRDAAMVMIGLRLGFRTSDVINLKFSDINWKEKEVSIIQYKTKVHIKLPLCTDVGNAIFRYLKYGRPFNSSEYIFISHKAPYGKLSGKICSNGLNRILYRCGYETSVTFHTLRKTFATNILQNNGGIEAVVDALGHQDQTTVDKYLTFDEFHMKKCPLSLSDLDIQMGGMC